MRPARREYLNTGPQQKQASSRETKQYFNDVRTLSFLLSYPPTIPITLGKA